MTDGRRAWAPLLPPTSFVGRREDIATLDALLAEHRLVSVVGPGGAGKTRVAVELGACLSDRFGGRVRFVDLSPTADGAVASSAIGASAAELHAPTLVIVDNCEHVLAAAAAAIADLLVAGPLTVLATSRVRLGLASEVIHVLPPLLPADAMRLFCDRAELVGVREEPGPAVDAVCERLDRLPLAVELAAARTRTFTPAELARHLDDVPLLGDAPAGDRPERHRTLRAAVTWSHSLLSPADQRAFRRLGVFAGRADRGAAIAVLRAAPDGLDQLAASEALDRLVDGSLVQAGRDGDTTWFRLPFTIRASAREHLAGTDDEIAARTAVLRWLDDLTAAIDGANSYGVESFQRIDAVIDDLRATLAWLSDTGRAADLVRFGSRLYHYWHVRGLITEGRRWLERARALDDGADDAASVRVLNGLGNLAQMAGDLAGARTHYEECLAVRRRIGWAPGIATTLNDLGTCCLAQGDLDEASAALHESLGLHTAGHDRWGEACAHLNLGIVVRLRGDLDGAADLIAAAVDGFAGLGDALNALVGRANIASIDLARERWADAAGVLGPAIADAHAAHALALLPPLLEAAATAASAVDQASRAARLLGAADARRVEQGQPRNVDEAGETDELRRHLQGELGRDAADAAMAEGATLALVDVVALAQHDTPAPQRPERRAPTTMRLAREGDTWAVGPPGAEHRLRASKGLAYLARLLAQPEREIHVLDLAGSTSELAGGVGAGGGEDPPPHPPPLAPRALARPAGGPRRGRAARRRREGRPRRGRALGPRARRGGCGRPRRPRPARRRPCRTSQEGRDEPTPRRRPPHRRERRSPRPPPRGRPPDRDVLRLRPGSPDRLDPRAVASLRGLWRLPGGRQHRQRRRPP
jgi:predicted ATPase